MALYVDGFVIPVPKKNLADYKKMAKLGCKIWMEHGALSYVEGVGDDLNVKYGLPFPKLTKTKASETVVFAFITYKSKADRNRINKLVMADKRMQTPPKMPFDFTKMAFGGFKAMISNDTTAKAKTKKKAKAATKAKTKTKKK